MPHEFLIVLFISAIGICYVFRMARLERAGKLTRPGSCSRKRIDRTTGR